MTVAGGLSDRALALFAVSPEDLPGLRAAAGAVCDDARLSEWIGTTAADLTAAMGSPSPPPPLTPRPALERDGAADGESDAVTAAQSDGGSDVVAPTQSDGEPDGLADAVAYLPVVAFAEVLPATLAWAETRSIPAPVVAATLADVGRMLRRNRLWYGRAGLDHELAAWLPRHLTGSILQVGRLQHERSMAGVRTGLWLVEDGADYAPGEVCVNLHIPETGPLDPTSVEESLRAGRSLLRKRFPEHRLRVRFCVSWLLDPQLLEYLPESSNIVAFHRRFRIGPAKDDDGDMSVRKFVFGAPYAPVDALPQRTVLERAVVAHWRAGRHWRVHVGRLP